MKERLKNKNNIILGSLLAVVLLLAVGYAAFATNLNIGGASNIDTSWDILITNLTSTTTGTASDNNSTYDRLTANLSANLVAPGDSITYEVTVTNRGTLDAILSSIEKTTVNNDYISVTYSGLTVNDPLYKNESRKLIITVAFKDIEVSNLTTTDAVDFSVTLNYTQKTTQFDPQQLVTVSYSTSLGTCEDCEDIQMNLSDTITNIPVPYLEGYRNEGWYTGGTGSGVKVVEGIKVVRLYEAAGGTGDNLHLYPNWIVINYKINYANTQGLNLNVNPTYKIYNQSAYKTTKVKGYTFQGINTSPTNEGLNVTNETTVSDVIEYLYGAGVTEIPNDEITLYMDFSLSHFTFAYDSQGGDAVSSETYTVHDTLKTPTITKEGYTFDGWYTKSGGRGTKIEPGDLAEVALTVTKADGSTVTLYANWIAN